MKRKPATPLAREAEAFIEMLTAERGASKNTVIAYRGDLLDLLGFLARRKQGAVTASVKNRVEVLDSLCDQIVTVVGVGYCAGMNVAGGLEEVNRSNWSKFVNGVPMKNEYGKIVKGDGYKAPDLKDFV